jgi:toxin ParE1/3/4
MRLRWTLSAAADLEGIYNYLQLHAPLLAHSTVMEIYSSVRSLKKFPHQGRPGVEAGTRELLHDRLPYIVAYRVKEDAIELLHIWHPAQDRP